jgi:hypothetical protein
MAADSSAMLAARVIVRKAQNESTATAESLTGIIDLTDRPTRAGRPIAIRFVDDRTTTENRCDNGIRTTSSSSAHCATSARQREWSPAHRSQHRQAAGSVGSSVRVWNEHRDTPWPALLDYWGLPNLQVINREVHVAKCATEARDRRVARVVASESA